MTFFVDLLDVDSSRQHDLPLAHRYAANRCVSIEEMRYYGKRLMREACAWYDRCRRIFWCAALRELLALACRQSETVLQPSAGALGCSRLEVLEEVSVFSCEPCCSKADILFRFLTLCLPLRIVPWVQALPSWWLSNSASQSKQAGDRVHHRNATRQEDGVRSLLQVVESVRPAALDIWTSWVYVVVKVGCTATHWVAGATSDTSRLLSVVVWFGGRRCFCLSRDIPGKDRKWFEWSKLLANLRGEEFFSLSRKAKK